MLGLLVIVAVVFILLPGIFAANLAIVYSASMGSAMPVGALAVIEPVDPAQVKVGDIIAFNPTSDSETTVSHRVIEVMDGETLSFRTKGDANEEPDLDIVPSANVVAKVCYNIPSLGYVLDYIARYSRGSLGFVLFITLPTVLLIGSAVRDVNFMLSPTQRRARIRKKIMERRKKRRLW